MATNFSDKDPLNLGGLRGREPGEPPGISVRSAPLGGSERPAASGLPGPRALAGAGVSGAERMARHKEDVTAQVSDTVSEIERLRLRQEELEREKKSLEELAQKQQEYEAGKRDIVEKLNRSLILLEKDETQAERMVEMLSQTRAKFLESLTELRSIDESRWPETDFRVELSRASAKVEAARDLYNLKSA